jgi:hypothetical protein
MLKEYNQLPQTQVAPAKAGWTFPAFPPRVVFDQLTLTRLNVVPTNIHRDAASTGAVLTGADARHRLIDNPADIAEGFCVDDCNLAVFVNGTWEPQGNIIRGKRDQVYQDVTPPADYPTSLFFREYIRVDPKTWRVVLWSQPSGALEPEQIGESAIADSEIVYQYFGKGIVYGNQWTFWRLEEIKWGIQTETSDFNLSTIIVGELGRNAQGAIDQLNQGRRIAALPGRNSNAIKVSDSNVIDKLMGEYESLKADYLNATYLIDMGQQPNRPVAMDSALRLAPQVRYRDSVREAMEEYYEQFGLKLTFKDTVNPATAQEVQVSMSSLQIAEQAGWIQKKDAGEKAQKILGVKSEVSDTRQGMLEFDNPSDTESQNE